jgi:hypothetical protein
VSSFSSALSAERMTHSSWEKLGCEDGIKRWTPDFGSVQTAGTHHRAVCRMASPHCQPVV